MYILLIRRYNKKKKDNIVLKTELQITKTSSFTNCKVNKKKDIDNLMI